MITKITIGIVLIFMGILFTSVLKIWPMGFLLTIIGIIFIVIGLVKKDIVPMKKVCGICSKRVKGGKYLIIKGDGGKGKPLYNICLHCNVKFRMATKDEVPYPLNPEETRKIIENSAYSSGVPEMRMQCSVCGHIFCYTAEDLEKNMSLAGDAVFSSLMAVGESIGGTRIAANQNLARADNATDKIVDYSRCPKCHSSDLKIADNDVVTNPTIPTISTPQNTPLITYTDELKKLKELLDAGVITQEEFETKKKQLLGV